ncbi:MULTISPECIES: DUF4982 domain-containing protein [Pseudofrankia]|uniref:DUF4982 domain-containing protein n=1 Tax=Pseudofrankia TaxID=2994363 RepID=UPI000234C49E|nr:MULTISPECIES: DUF4982 domain-containing protein [Pseudofrankia]OHV30390.1 hypothetical protein BCD49_33590 [Pseudofrankia sp. EUN1h]
MDSDADEVDLPVNGRWAGTVPAGEKNRFEAEFGTVYEPGEIITVAYTGGAETGRSPLRSAATEVRLRTTADRARIAPTTPTSVARPSWPHRVGRRVAHRRRGPVHSVGTAHVLHRRVPAPALHPRWISPETNSQTFARIRKDGGAVLAAGRASEARKARHLLAVRTRDQHWQAAALIPNGDACLTVGWTTTTGPQSNDAVTPWSPEW